MHWTTLVSLFKLSAKTPGVDLKTQYYPDGKSLANLQAENQRLPDKVRRLFDGSYPLTDEFVADQVRDIIMHTLCLDAVDECNPDVPETKVLQERSDRLLACAVELKRMQKAFEAGRREGLRARDGGSRAR